MSESQLITASIVLYENPVSIVAAAIKSFLNSDFNLKIFLVDNSSTNFLKVLESYSF